MLRNKGLSTGLKRVAQGLFAVASILLYSETSTFATGSVTLTWNASTDPNVAGYRIYYGVASRVYTNVVDVGDATSVSISNLTEGVTYYFAATAYNVLGMESGYSDETSYTVPLTVLPNQAPTLDALAALTVNESAGLQTVNLTGISSGASNETQTLTVTATSSSPALIPNPTVNYTSPNATGTLTFTPVALAFGSATITVTVNDGAASNNVVTRTFVVTVLPVNNPPTLNALTNRALAESAGLQTVNLSGISSGATNETQTLTVTATSSNTGLIPNPTVNYTSPNATGTLTFTPVASVSGSATVTVTVNDGGASNNIVTRTFTVTVNGANNAPTLDALNNVTLLEGAGVQTINLNGITSGAVDEAQTLTVTASSSNVGLIPNPTVNYVSPNATGTLNFTPNPDGFGSATITVTVNDGGASNNIVTRTFTVTAISVNDVPTLNALTDLVIDEGAAQQTVSLTGISSGATNESQALTVTATSSNPALIPNPTVTYTSANPAGSLRFTPVALAFGSATITVNVNDNGASNNIVTRTFSVTVNPVNNAPTLNTVTNLTISEGAGLQTVTLTGISSGASNEVQTLTVTTTSSNPGLISNPTVNYTSPNATGTLTFTPAASMSGVATITVTVNDGGASNNIVTRTFTVTVNGVNNAPTLDALTNLTMNEGAGLQTVNLTGISSGASNEVQTLTVTASSGNPALIPNPAVNYTSPNASGTLTFAPAALAFGSTTVTVTVNDGSASNNIVTRTFTVTVNPVNNSPTLNAPSDVTVSEGAGQQTVNLTGISSGASNEVQTLTVTATSSNPALIPNPSVNYTSPNATGTLTFTPAALGFGSATITVTVNDGGASNNIVTRTFNVTVTDVNQAPTLNGIGNLALAESAGLQTVNLSGITSGASNEIQTLTVTATSSNPGLIPNPTVNYASPNTTGTLTFTPASGSGSAIITVTVNDGAAANNVVTRTFTVTVNANTPPTISTIANQIIATNTNTGSLAFVVGDAETAATNLVVWAASSYPALIPTNNIVFSGSGSNRTVTLTPVLNLSGDATITLTVSDGIATTGTSFQLSVLGPPAPPTMLTVVMNGNGSVTPNLTAEALTVGRKYTLTATPGTDQVFVGWSGSVASSLPTVSFVMQPNMLLQANFVPNPFVAARGNYNGLFHETDEVRLNRSGYFRIAVSSRGVYTGWLLLGAKRYSVSGRFSLQGQATNRIYRVANSPLTLEMTVGGPQGDEIVGRLTDGAWIANLGARRSAFDAGLKPVSQAGLYTLIVPGQTSDLASPMGSGFGTVRVGTNGVVRFAGVLGDGTRVSQSALISRDGQWPFFAPLYSGYGQVMSWLTFTNLPASDLNGTLSWIKTANMRARYYSGGFTNEYETVGSAYVAPLGTNTVLNFANSRMDFIGGNLASDLTTDLTIGPGNTRASGTGLLMRFSVPNGLFYGKKLDPASGRWFNFSGAVLQKINAGYGYLLGPNQTSQVILTP